MQVELVKSIVREAGKAALSYAGKFHHNLKEDASPVTEADLLVQDFLHTRFKSLFPDYKFLGEETAASSGYSSFEENDYIWVVDPIDGTDGFREGLSSWGISVALVHRFRPVFGVFYMPATDTLFWSDTNSNAYENGKVLPQLTAVSSTSFYIPSDFHLEFKTDYPGKLRCIGSTVAHMCYLARSAGCGALIRGFLWDIAAGLAILESVGGRLIDLDKQPYSFREHFAHPHKSVCLFAVPTQEIPAYIQQFSVK